jgi:hypothetical protein
MPSLSQSLQGRDLGYLRIVADLWGQDLTASDARDGLSQLVVILTNPSQVSQVLVDLDVPEQAALNDLLHNSGRLPWALFTRRHGVVREMGAAARDRDLPHRNPISPVEALWYRALIGRAFFGTPSGPEEFAYIPDDLIALIPEQPRQGQALFGRLALAAEKAYPVLVTDHILDDACTLLAGLRMGLELESMGVHFLGSVPPYGLNPSVLQELLLETGLLGEDGIPLSEPVRAFLEAERGEALAILARAWLESDGFDELHRIPGLSCEGEWQHDPHATRGVVIDMLTQALGEGIAVATGSSENRPFISLAAFVEAVRYTRPDFQRPAGNYDSWFIRDRRSGEFLRGFESWDRVDGELIRYIIGGPLHWLGITELAFPQSPEVEMPSPFSAFRFSPWAESLLQGKALAGLLPEQAVMHAVSDGILRIPSDAPRSVRYQAARFCQWQPVDHNVYRYRITSASLEQANGAGLRASHLLALLRRYAPQVPPSLARALERWEERGCEARLDRLVVLRVRNPEILQAMQKTRVARFLGEPLGPAAVVVKTGAAEKIVAALAELGYLSEVELGEPAGEQ